jgi:amidase
VIALPSAQLGPFPRRMGLAQKSCGTTHGYLVYHRWMEIVVPVSLAGLPCVTIPAGFGGSNGLPMGIQLAAKRGNDAQLLRLAQAYHEVVDWPSKHPPAVGIHTVVHDVCVSGM